MNVSSFFSCPGPTPEFFCPSITIILENKTKQWYADLAWSSWPQYSETYLRRKTLWTVYEQRKTACAQGRNHLVLLFNQWQRSTVDRDLEASCIVRRVVRVLTSPRMNVPHFAMHRTLWFVPFDMTCNINQYRMYIISSKSKSSITTDSRILEPNPWKHATKRNEGY